MRFSISADPDFRRELLAVPRQRVRKNLRIPGCRFLPEGIRMRHDRQMFPPRQLLRSERQRERERREARLHLIYRRKKEGGEAEAKKKKGGKLHSLAAPRRSSCPPRPPCLRGASGVTSESTRGWSASSYNRANAALTSLDSIEPR